MGVSMQSSGEITKKTNPYNITKQIQCTHRSTFKTIRAAAIARSTRIKCLEVLFQIPTWITTDLADNRIRIFLPTLVNSNPLYLLDKITTHTIQGLSSHIKIYLINRYRDNCSNTNCYVCQYQFWCFIVINMLASFDGALLILNTFIGTNALVEVLSVGRFIISNSF